MSLLRGEMHDPALTHARVWWSFPHLRRPNPAPTHLVVLPLSLVPAQAAPRRPLPLLLLLLLGPIPPRLAALASPALLGRRLAPAAPTPARWRRAPEAAQPFQHGYWSSRLGKNRGWPAANYPAAMAHRVLNTRTRPRGHACGAPELPNPPPQGLGVCPRPCCCLLLLVCLLLACLPPSSRQTPLPQTPGCRPTPKRARTPVACVVMAADECW